MDPRQFLIAVRRRLLLALLTEGAARICAIVVTVAVLAVAIDWAWRLPGWIRCGLLLGVLAAGALVAWTRLVRPFRRTWDDRSLALFSERRIPALGGRLLSRIDGIDLGPHDDAQLRTALAAVPLATLVPARRTPRQLAIAGAAVLAVLITAILAPGIAADGLLRLVLPLGDTHWRRHTVIEARLAAPVVPVDGSLQVEITRRHPDAAHSSPVVVTWMRADAAANTTATAERRQLPGLTGSAWSTAISGPPGAYRITIASGDAESVELTGAIVHRPTVARVAAEITPPAYTGLPTSTLDALGGSLIPGSTVALSFALAAAHDRPISSASALLDPGGELPLRASAASGSWLTEFTLREATAVVIDAVDGDGIRLAGPAGAARFPIGITPDRAPSVSISGPSPREAVSMRAVLKLELAAGDDFGLASLALHGRATQAVEHVGTAASNPSENASDTWPAIERFGAVIGQTSTTRTADVAVASLARDGAQQIELSAVAIDQNDVSGPGIGRSDVLVLRIVSDDQLRQELDRSLSEARERIGKARDDVAQAADPAKRATALRSATQAAERGGQVLSQVLRRWRDNRLPDDGIAPAATAQQRIDDAALPALAVASGQDRSAEDTARATADAALADAERLLASILQEGDLTRLLQSLIARQTALAGESRTFVRSFLTKPLDAAGKTHQQTLATRQRELSDQALDIEHRLLAKEGSTWTAAQAIVRQEAPGDRLRAAATDIASTDRRPKAIDAQKTALDSLARILAALQTTDAAKELVQRVGELARQQEQLAKELERGAAPGSLTERQQALQDATERLQREAAAAQPDAAKLLAAAAAAQSSAGRGMSAGNGTAGARDANAAAGLLREAQKALDGEQNRPPEDGKQPDPTVDVLALLKELRTGQAALVTDVTLLDQVQREQPLAFDAQRQVKAFAQTQSDLLLRLQEEALKPLTKNPIAQLGIQRVESAMRTSAEHLGTPALGARSVRLSRAALTEIGRLIDVAEDLPSGKSEGGGGGGGGGQSPQAPFPPRAELALLAAMQAEIAARTAAGAPQDLAGEQKQLQQFVEAMIGTVRPETRPWVLLERTRRAMTSAAYQLAQRDRSLLTRHEQQAAEAALRRLLAESGGGGQGGGGGGGGSGDQQQQPQSGQQPQAQSDPQQGAQGGDPQAQAGQNGDPSQGGAGQTSAVQVQRVEGDLMQLPPQIREQLRQAREQAYTPAQLRVYQRYLELLEESR